MPKSKDNFVLPWREDDGCQPTLGEGISRPMAKARTTLFKLLVKPSRAQPMTVSLPAENKAAAVRYAQNRWPQAEVAVLDEDKSQRRRAA